MILNGLATYTTWTVIATLINFATALVYQSKVTNETASLVSLSLLVVFHTAWFVTENFIAERFARYVDITYIADY